MIGTRVVARYQPGKLACVPAHESHVKAEGVVKHVTTKGGEPVKDPAPDDVVTLDTGATLHRAWLVQ